MIKKLRRKLIAACMLSLAVVLLVILGGVNLVSYQKVVADADTVLSLLAANGGVFPKGHQDQGERPEGGVPPVLGKKDPFAPRILSPETPMSPGFSPWCWGRMARCWRRTWTRSPP